MKLLLRARARFVNRCPGNTLATFPGQSMPAGQEAALTASNTRVE